VNEIKRGLLAYLMGEQPFQEFLAWLSDIAWDPMGKFTAADVDLIRDIQLRTAEFTGGYLTEDELKSELRDLVGFAPRVISILWKMENAPVRHPNVVRSSATVQARQKVAFS
jgi:hypothetical protein